MKKLGLLIIVFALGHVVLAQNANEFVAAGNMAEVNWEADVYDFGTIEKGTPVSHEFKFTNTGDSPLVITNVKASCGCTATDYPKNAVQPGESASITATYNAKASGSFTKTITVYTNTEVSVQTLRIKGVVE